MMTMTTCREVIRLIFLHLCAEFFPCSSFLTYFIRIDIADRERQDEERAKSIIRKAKVEDDEYKNASEEHTYYRLNSTHN